MTALLVVAACVAGSALVCVLPPRNLGWRAFLTIAIFVTGCGLLGHHVATLTSPPQYDGSAP